MKRIIGVLMMVALCLSLAACGNENGKEQSPQETQTGATSAATEETQQQSESTAPTEDQKAEQTEQQSIELSGPWHLDGTKNDLTAFPERFPGYEEWGASMEIQSDGQMSWHIGAAGGYGTYTIENDLLHATLVSDTDQKDMPMDFRILVENEEAVLEMDYQDMTICWAYGDQANTDYPGPDVAEIVNPRGDETTVYQLADGTYMDRADRRFTYNGTDTWTDEDGVEWNEVVKD